MSTDKNIFCLLHCFNNYEVVAGKIIEFYIQNASKHLYNNNKLNIRRFYDSTPFILYSWYFLPGESVPLPPQFTRTKQLTDFVIILALTAVTLARIANSDVTIFGSQGAVIDTGFATMYTLANQMNKQTVYWTNDLRNIWGTSDDPLFIGMAPLPYKYLWTSQENQTQDPKFNSQPKGLNGSLVSPNLAQSKNLCPVVDSKKFEDNWNSFIDLLKRSDSVQKQTIPGTMTSRTTNLVALGNAIIEYVEVTKKNNSSLSSLGSGWFPNINTTLYLDIEYVISQNLGLLYTEEQEFFRANTVNKDMHPSRLQLFNKKIDPMNNQEFKAKNQYVYGNRTKLINAMTNGFIKMSSMSKTF